MKGVIFDMDGLLIDTESIYMKCDREILVDMGYEYDHDLVLRCIGVNNKTIEEEFLKHYGDDFPIKEFRERVRVGFREYVDQYGLGLKEGVIEILEHFKKEGFKIALGTSTGEATARKNLAITGIIDYFDAIATGDMVEHGKPAPDIFLLAAKKIGLEPKECYVFEDSYNGIRAAHTGGFYAVMVPDILQPTEEIKALTNKICEKLTKFL